TSVEGEASGRRGAGGCVWRGLVRSDAILPGRSESRQRPADHPAMPVGDGQLVGIRLSRRAHPSRSLSSQTRRHFWPLTAASKDETFVRCCSMEVSKRLLSGDVGRKDGRHRKAVLCPGGNRVSDLMRDTALAESLSQAFLPKVAPCI